MFVVLPIQICTVNVDRKLVGPAVTVKFLRQLMIDHTIPAFREFLLDPRSPPDDRDYVRVVVCLKQRQTLAVVEFSIEVDGFNLSVKLSRISRNSAKTALAVSPSN